MRKKIRRFEKISIIKKAVIIYICGVILPAFMVVIYLSKNEYNHLYSQAVSSRQQSLEQMTQNINTFMMSVEDLSQSLAYRSPLSNLISRNNLENFPIWTKRTTEESIEALEYTLKYQNLGIKNICIYSNRNELIENNIFFAESQLYGIDFYDNFRRLQKDWDLYYLDEKKADTYYTRKGITRHEKGTLLFVRKIQNEYDDVYSGVLIFEISPEKFLSYISLNGNGYGNYGIYFTNIRTLLGKKQDDKLIMKIQSCPIQDGVSRSEFLSGGLYTRVENYNMLIIDGRQINTGNYIILTLRILLIFIFLIVIQILVFRFLIVYILKKLNDNINKMDEIIANGFDGKIAVDDNDEFRLITMRYNILLDKIQALISDKIERERKIKEAQVKALQYQMNPHFIYNTLSIFASNAEESKNYKLSEAIAYFGHLLRYNIKNTGMFTTLRAELDNAYCLIKVYSIRYRESIELQLDVPQELYDVQIVKYLLQPILENVILHGGKSGKRQITVKIKIICCNKALNIKIEDNGIGIKGDYLETIRKNIIVGKESNKLASKSSFIGLNNIYKRLQLIYGTESDLMIDSVYGEGTTITIKIPLKDIDGSVNNEIFCTNR